MFASGICGIDIDGADGNSRREAEAAEVINLMQSYTEHSPSGTGYHIIFKCDISKIPRKDNKLDPAYYQKNSQTGLECYFAGLTSRYFTYTGESVNDRDIEDRTEQALIFLDKYMQKSHGQRTATAGDGYQVPTGAASPPPAQTGTQSESMAQATKNSDDILTIARRAKNGGKFSDLFDKGDFSPHYPSHSEADEALCLMLSFYTGDDARVIDDLFRQSALYRAGKWEREDYRNGTIQKAITERQAIGQYYKKGGRPRKDPHAEVKCPAEAAYHAQAMYFNPFETPEKRQRYGINDIGAGYLFADTYRNISRYVPEAKAWYVYDGRVWKMDVGGVIVAQQAKDLTDHMLNCRKLLDDNSQEAWVKFVTARMKKPARDAMIADAASVYPVSIMEFDKNPYIFNCQNCTLDLKTFKIHKHRAEDYLSKLSNVVFDKDAKCERWNRFIDEIMRGDADTAKFFKKALGYTLTGETAEECFFILYGATTRNGKGTAMESALYMLGDYGKTAQPETKAQKQTTHGAGPSEDIARLRGARFVNMSEPDKGLRLNSALVKQMTGGDTMTARYLHQNSFEFRPEYKLFINTNHLPRVGDDSIFKSGRVKLIGTHNTIFAEG